MLNHASVPLAAAGVAVVGATVATGPLEITPWIQLGAGVVATLSGLASMAWYIYNLKREISVQRKTAAVASAIVLAAADAATKVVHEDAKTAASVVVAAAAAAAAVPVKRRDV